ncbi:MAG TPA: tetratricopeptide repeat protein, partial [Polyangiaceae bacterium]|nr:tetratricopeptide repeat protein [Polyangiaceae bacterium]
MSHLILSGLFWAFSFWLVADALRRQSNPLWVVLILLVQPYGGLVYLAYSRWQAYRRGRAGAAPRVVVPAEVSSAPEDSDAEPLLEFADGLEERAQFAEAATLYRNALEQRPGDPRGLHGLARCLIELGQKREALEVYEALMTAEPRFRNYAAALEYA